MNDLAPLEGSLHIFCASNSNTKGLNTWLESYPTHKIRKKQNSSNVGWNQTAFGLYSSYYFEIKYFEIPPVIGSQYSYERYEFWNESTSQTILTRSYQHQNTWIVPLIYLYWSIVQYNILSIYRTYILYNLIQMLRKDIYVVMLHIWSWYSSTLNRANKLSPEEFFNKTIEIPIFL